METPVVTKERILLLRKAVVPFFSLLAGLLIGARQAPRADATTPFEVVKAKVTVRKHNGQTIFEVKPQAAEGEEAYVQVVGDIEYPEGALTRLFRPVIRLEPTISEPDASPRPSTPEKPAARAPQTKRPLPKKTHAFRQESRRAVPPLPPINLEIK